MITIIAIDMDGTLLNSENKISKENIHAINKAQELGYEVVIATGRAHYDAKKIIEEVGLSLYLICANGSTIHSPSGTEILSNSAPYHEAREVIEWLENNKYYYELICHQGIYTPNWGKDVLQEEMNQLKDVLTQEDFAEIEHWYEKQLYQSGYVYMDDFEKVFQDEQKIYKILVFSFNDEKRKKGWDQFEGKTDLSLMYSSPYNFELQHPKSSKGQAVQYLRKVLNLIGEKSMAIGDSGNDLSMFEIVSDSYAMENANDDVKSKAKHLTANNDAHGVAQAINHFLNS